MPEEHGNLPDEIEEIEHIVQAIQTSVGADTRQQISNLLHQVNQFEDDFTALVQDFNAFKQQVTTQLEAILQALTPEPTEACGLLFGKPVPIT